MQNREAPRFARRSLAARSSARTAVGARTARLLARFHGPRTPPSTASQTAWALLGLMAAGESDHPAVARGVDYLAAQSKRHGLWDEEELHRVGFPASSICAITAIANISRSGRSRGIAISKAAMRARWRGGCEGSDVAALTCSCTQNGCRLSLLYADHCPADAKGVRSVPCRTQGSACGKGPIGCLVWRSKKSAVAKRCGNQAHICHSEHSVIRTSSFST